LSATDDALCAGFLLDDQTLFFRKDLHSHPLDRVAREEDRHPARERLMVLHFLVEVVARVAVEVRFDWR
jgi:hypothetical protein